MMPSPTFFKREAKHFETLLEAAEKAMNARQLEVAQQAIQDFETALGLFIANMQTFFDTFWQQQNELKEMECVSSKISSEDLQEKEEQLIVNIRFIQTTLQEVKPQLFAAKYQEKLQDLKLRFATVAQTLNLSVN